MLDEKTFDKKKWDQLIIFLRINKLFKRVWSKRVNFLGNEIQDEKGSKEAKAEEEKDGLEE